MSRSGYIDDFDDNWALIRWRGQVASAIRGERGQALLRDLVTALDAMPEKSLIADELVTPEGDVCALGAVGKLRGVDMTVVDPEDYESVATIFNVAEPLAREIEYLNDERYRRETPEQRWTRMREWAASQIKQVPGQV